MSAWADLAGDDSNLSMAADEFGELSVLGDISNSVSQNRSRFDPELDSSKQGLNRKLKLFGLGNDSNSNLSKKRRHSELQTEEDDVDMPPKSKQRTSGPSENNFSRFLEPVATSAPDLSSLSSSSTSASGTTGSLSTPQSTETNQPRTWYSDVLLKPGQSRKKRTPKSASSSHVPDLISTTSTTANPTPKSASKFVKLRGSLPNSVRRRRMRNLKRKSAGSPSKRCETSTRHQEEDGAVMHERELEMTDVAEEKVGLEQEQPQQRQYQPMDEDGGGDTREALEQGLKVLKTETKGRIYVPIDILESTEKRAEKDQPTPFRMMRPRSVDKCGSMSPTKLSFTEENSPPSSKVSDSCASSPPVTFDRFNFHPLPIPASAFGLPTSTSVSTSETPNSEQVDGNQEADLVTQPQPTPMFTFLPFTSPVLPMNGIVFPQPNLDESKAQELSGGPVSPNALVVNFVPMQLPLSTQIPNLSPTTLASSPVFLPFGVVPPTVVQPIVSEPIAQSNVGIAVEEAVSPMDTETAEVVDVDNVREEVEPVSIPSTSVWAAAPCEDDDDADENASWAKKCFKREVARNKILKRQEEQQKVEQKKLEMQYRIREKELLPIDQERRSGAPYGSDNRNDTRRREYHPYAVGSQKTNNFQNHRRTRGRARTRSLSEGVESPFSQRKVYRKKDLANESETNDKSPSKGGSLSVSVEARDLPLQEPEPLTDEKLAWRNHQIEMAKNTDGYRNYVAQIPKCQRKKKHPSTPNPKEKISKRRWIGKYKKWRQQLHEFDNDASMDIDEETQQEGQTKNTTINDSASPTPVDAECVPSAPKEEQ